MRDLSELYLRQSKPSPTAEIIAEFEAYFRVKLPDNYLQFLASANGGEPMLDCTFDYTTVFEKFVEDADQVKEFCSLTDDRDDIGGVWENTQFLRNVFKSIGRDDNVICIALNGESEIIYLDFAANPPCVFAVYRGGDHTTPKIASSFDEFLDCLHPRR